MEILWIILWLPVGLSSIMLPLDVKSTESSEDYLRKVMIELQDLQTPHSLVPVYSNVNNDAHYFAGKRLSASMPHFLPTVVYEPQDLPLKTMDNLDTSASNQYYQQVIKNFFFLYFVC